MEFDKKMAAGRFLDGEMKIVKSNEKFYNMQKRLSGYQPQAVRRKLKQVELTGAARKSVNEVT